MATYFSITRPYLSKDLLELKKYPKTGDRILDLGCGNGRLTQLFDRQKIDYVGVDTAAKMVEIAQKKYPQDNFFIQKNPIKIDMPTDTFDLVFCLSVFHHVPSEQSRLKYLKEIHRVLKPNGRLILTVWNLNKRRHLTLELLANKIKNRRIDWGDLFITFKDNTGQTIAQRYHHRFKQDEIVSLLENADFTIEELRHDKRGKKYENENIVLIAKKA